MEITHLRPFEGTVYSEKKVLERILSLAKEKVHSLSLFWSRLQLLTFLVLFRRVKKWNSFIVCVIEFYGRFPRFSRSKFNRGNDAILKTYQKNVRIVVKKSQSEKRGHFMFFLLNIWFLRLYSEKIKIFFHSKKIVAFRFVWRLFFMRRCFFKMMAFFDTWYHLL